MTLLDEALTQTDSTAFLAMVQSKPFTVFMAAIAARLSAAEIRLASISTWEEACRLQGAIKSYQGIPQLCGDIERELKKLEKEG